MGDVHPSIPRIKRYLPAYYVSSNRVIVKRSRENEYILN